MAEDRAIKRTIEELRHLLGDRLSTAEDVRAAHAHDESYHPAQAPDAVAFPESTEEVSRIVHVCASHRAPIVPFGAGSAVEGGVVAIEGGIAIDLRRMNRIVRVSADDMDATVQAGVTRKQLNDHLLGTSLFFPVDPGADATLGGMAATRASGSCAVRYGTMRENVLSLQVVLADGRVITTASRARKSAAGYDLTRLFVGSEGTLGIITEATVRLYREPEAVSAAVCTFPTIDQAVQSVIQIIQTSVGVSRIELLDEVQMDAINRYSSLNHPVAPTLFFEFTGTEQAVVEQAQRAEAIVTQQGAAFCWATGREERDKLWEARHNAYYAALAMRPGCRGLATDVCVPISRLADCIRETKADLETCSLPVLMVGHVGDGNFHVLFLIDPDQPAELAEAERFNSRMVHRALEMEGTCTGEHGIGCGKLDFLLAEFGPAADVMRSIKRSLDPHNLMNPGKVIVM